MKVKLAGFNVDYEMLKMLSKGSKVNYPFTPEVFSAAYARISRSPKSVTELRNIAKKEIKKARRSNRKIIFEMGHHSVAEHAVFNFDIMDISRLMAEELEKYRLCSYTEKSQRYIKLTGNFVIPQEIAKGPYVDRFKKIIKRGIQFYHKLYKRIIDYGEKKLGHIPTKEEKKEIVLKANEDARYILSLSQKTQLGETINARNLELILRRFASHPLNEANELGEKLFALVKKIAPSIILFYKANDYDKKTYLETEKLIARLRLKDESPTMGKDVVLVDFTKNADIILLATIIHSVSNISFKQSLKTAKSMGAKKRKEIIKSVFKYLELYDTVLREFEYINLTFSLIVSASCFAQLKRHRQATITAQRYDPELGVTIPKSVYEVGADNEFKEIIDMNNELFYKLQRRYPYASQYVLTNAHRRRVLASMNARELYHISRLREDEHAQWEIREKTKKMVALAKKVMPLTLLLIGGKDHYPELYKKLFGKYPRVIKPILPS